MKASCCEAKEGRLVRRNIKVEVRIASEYSDRRHVLSGSKALNQEDRQSEVDKFFHFPKHASREYTNHGITDRTQNYSATISGHASLARTGRSFPGGMS